MSAAGAAHAPLVIANLRWMAETTPSPGLRTWIAGVLDGQGESAPALAGPAGEPEAVRLGAAEQAALWDRVVAAATRGPADLDA